MPQALIMYYSRSGNTKTMAQIIGDQMAKDGLSSTVKDVEGVAADELLGYEAIIIGSPTYYGTMAFQIKKLIDETVRFHGKLDGKVGGAFASSANVAGGNETTVLDILNAMLIHGMIIRGQAIGDHYGPVSINAPDERAIKNCQRFASGIAQLVKKLYPE